MGQVVYRVAQGIERHLWGSTGVCGSLANGLPEKAETSSSRKITGKANQMGEKVGSHHNLGHKGGRQQQFALNLRRKQIASLLTSLRQKLERASLPKEQ